MSIRDFYSDSKCTVERHEFALQFLKAGYGWLDLFRGGPVGTSKCKFTIILKQLGTGDVHLCNLGVHH